MLIKYIHNITTTTSEQNAHGEIGRGVEGEGVGKCISHSLLCNFFSPPYSIGRFGGEIYTHNQKINNNKRSN